MDVFDLRDHLIRDYSDYISSFIQIRDSRIREYIDRQLNGGLLWPDPLIQLNPAFEPGGWIDELVAEGLLHRACVDVFRRKSEEDPNGKKLRLHRHQEDAIRTARQGHNYVLTTGTGSGKSLAYIIPIVDFILRNGSGQGTKAIIVYPMNALANSQLGELRKFLSLGFDDGKGPVTFERYTGQESDEEKRRIMSNPPDILLTNYVMLELILTRPEERKTLVNAAQGLRFLVLDELHTYRGRQGADVALLVRRVRNALNAGNLQCIGTSATLSSTGTLAEQRQKVADTASLLFGAQVQPAHIIGETLRRATQEHPESEPDFVSGLRARITRQLPPPENYAALLADSLASWIESTLGITSDPLSGRLVRAMPRSLRGDSGAARQLSRLTGLPEAECEQALAETLLQGFKIEDPETNRPAFAFRLHQFISRGDTVYASVESEHKRYFTVQGQKFVPGHRERLLLPLSFCRECGQEYYVVRRAHDKTSGMDQFLPRRLPDRAAEDGGEAGYLYLSSAFPWPEDEAGLLERLPEDWLEEHNGGLRVRYGQRKYLPETRHIAPDGLAAVQPGLLEETQAAQFVPAPFRFCLHCGVTYGGRQTTDFSKLTELSSGGRSTDTTILSLSLIRSLRADDDLRREARKLLSFTDNRQDASLQAGHFNDFIEIALLRSALYRAVQTAGAQGIAHEILPQRVFDALKLDFAWYAIDPEVRFAQKAETERALREVLGYRIYRDLKRGWRITSPNLEQCGLLELHYTSLDEVCQAEDLWQDRHPALAAATPETRQRVCRVLLDYMRRELAIKVSYLDPNHQESLRQLSSQRLRAPWAMDENEKLEHAAILFPRSRREQEEYGGNVFLSPRGGFGQYVRRSTTFPEYGEKIRLEETAVLLQDLLEALRAGGLVEIVHEPKQPGEVYGYQIPASALLWKAGDGSKAFHDPIRVPRLPETGGRTNPFFVHFYRRVTDDMHGLEAHEHTAQVPAAEREKRENKFRAGDLPILYCSPTMELGVDIAELNAVNMRNVPPTPANYAQRSGRAGRSGQPALVFTYCTMGSPHDQYYFKRPEKMVAGAVQPPRLELANEDLLRAHIQAVWLSESGLHLGASLKDLLDLSGAEPSLEPLDFVQQALSAEGAHKKAARRAGAILSTIEDELQQAQWYHPNWLAETLAQIPLQFERACERWRSIYRAARGQQKAQQQIIDDVSRPANDRTAARRLRQEAESQIDLLTDSHNLAQSDFYSYRYFAGEGFLPGYSFPRLPLSAYIPGRRITGRDDEFLSRPRFLAISEFGPRSIVYHEGSRYTIHKVNLPVAEGGEGLATQRARQCPACGYFHMVTAGDGLDRCERCGAEAGALLTNLFRLQNVSTRRRDRISSDEEERMRQGYELRTALRFHAAPGGDLAVRTARLEKDGLLLATLTYGDTATITRLNLGWRRRANPSQLGFVLDVERGFWAKQSEESGDGEPDDPLSARTQRVIPYVEDTKNSLLFEPAEALEPEQIASLQAALKSAIQTCYQLEDSELAAEPLPSVDNRRLILFYEAAEGGAGVLRRLLDTPEAFAEVAQAALSLCHFDPTTGADLRHADGESEDCEAACYNCLMSYYNQMDHRLLDRQAILDLLLDLAGARAALSPAPASRSAHLQQLRNLCQSDLELHWLDFLEERRLNLPSQAQKLIESCHTRPDFLYEKEHVAIYVDGYHHLFPERQQRDKSQQECLEDMGYSVLRFGLLEEWEKVIARYPALFGSEKRDNSR